MTFAFYNSSLDTEAQSLEQWGNWKSVVVITAEAALRCLSLAAVSFWHRASSKLLAVLWTEPSHLVCPWHIPPGLSDWYGTTGDWLWPCLYTTVLVYLGFFYRPGVPYTSGIRHFSIRNTCSTHRSWALMMVASMLVDLAWSRTFILVIWSCHLIPWMEQRARRWKSSSFFICLRYSVHLSQP